jgi:hypothetical protein
MGCAQHEAECAAAAGTNTSGDKITLKINDF